MSNGASAGLARNWWWGFVLFTGVSLVHIVGTFWPNWAGDNLTKLMLMPALAIAVMWALRGTRSRAVTVPATLLLLAIAFSWLGDGAGTFFPGLPELPVMLGCFGVAHALYIWLFWKKLDPRPVPRWAAVYVLWWVVLILILLPHTGNLAIAVALYGLLLGGTAFAAARYWPFIALGAVQFLLSDTVLAFKLFLPETGTLWTSPIIMLTYCAGQGLMSYGVVRLLQQARIQEAR